MRASLKRFALKFFNKFSCFFRRIRITDQTLSLNSGKIFDIDFSGYTTSAQWCLAGITLSWIWRYSQLRGRDRMVTIFKNAGLSDLSGGLHIFRRTFATRMYENGARVKEIAAYIGDLESTTERYYIAVRKKIMDGDNVNQVVMLPREMKDMK